MPLIKEQLTCTTIPDMSGIVVQVVEVGYLYPTSTT